MGQVCAVLEVNRVFLEKIITYKDGHCTQDERSKQVGVDVVAGTAQFPMIHKISISYKQKYWITFHVNCYNSFVNCKISLDLHGHIEKEALIKKIFN